MSTLFVEEELPLKQGLKPPANWLIDIGNMFG